MSLKSCIKKRLLGYKENFVKKPAILEFPFQIKKQPLGYYMSFGEKNKDLVFYVIWRDNYGSGFFSNFAFVICHLIVAKRLGYIPLIDFQNFKTLYNEDDEINGSLNAWNYYFEPVSKYKLEVVYESKNVFFCDGNYPKGFSYNLTEISDAISISDEFIRLNDNTLKFVNQSLQIDQTYLGVHFRGQEQNLAAGHPFGPTFKQLINTTSKILARYHLNKILMVTEERKAIDVMEKEFPGMIYYTNSFRSRKQNAYNMLNVRPNHRYLLGLEVLRDAYLLSKCYGAIFSGSNVSEYAKFVNRNEYKFTCRIQNGLNSENEIIAGYLFSVKKYLPQSLGGLRGDIIIHENKGNFC